jgi:dGTPase
MSALEAARIMGSPGRAPYASDPALTRGRLYPEPESRTRSVYQRDRDRIIHSAAFRRLNYKTQVFVYHEGDNYRTRMTHSLEVAQVARSLCRSLGLDEDLAEALALAHDLGHTPFGHAGEEALDAAMKGFGGFDHNGQTLRILTRLEARYAEFDGLNLTWETLEGIAKHNGPLVQRRGETEGLPWAVRDYVVEQELELDTWPGPEAQIAAFSDDIAYHSHDIDDGLRAGLFTVEDLAEVPLVGPIFGEVAARYPGLETTRLIHESIRRLIDEFVNDVLAETRRRLAAAAPRSADAVRALGRPVVAFSPRMAEDNQALRSFLYGRMYRHPRVKAMTDRARIVVRELFEAMLARPELLPADWRAKADGAGGTRTARLVADYIAGMTDRFALDEHAQIAVNK